MKLKDLIKNFEVKSIKGDINKDVTAISYDSRAVSKDSLFVAIKGENFDGHRFISEALSKGSNVIIAEKELEVPDDVTLIVLEDARKSLAKISARFFDNPSKKLKLVGVTGTNGKTTITYLLESIFKTNSWKTGVMGTIEHRYNNKTCKSSHTTPESYDLQKLLSLMVEDKINACVVEVSSHALTMNRVEECHFDGAVFTNLTPEHLDFHKEMDSYFAAKLKLFEEHLNKSEKENVFAVLNNDDPYGRKIGECFNKNIITYSVDNNADVKVNDLTLDKQGIKMSIQTPIGKFRCFSRLMGKFNAYNILAATCAAIRLGVSLDVIMKGIENMRTVPGRLECIKGKKGVLGFVDYAHTPDALKNILEHVKELISLNNKESKLITVFGCGGDRDKLKRPIMGNVVSSLSDIMIVTNDNPRTEDPGKIIKEIVSGIDNKDFEIIEDREMAIKRAVEIAQNEDVIVVAGKGHEDYQIIGKEKRHFDDREELKKFLEKE